MDLEKWQASCIYWYLLLPLILPYYIYTFRKHAQSSFTAAQHWFIAASLLFAIGLLRDDQWDTVVFLNVSYVSLLSLFLIAGELFSTKTWKAFKIEGFANAYTMLGHIGLPGYLLVFTYKSVWAEIAYETNRLSRYNMVWLSSPTTISAALLSLLALALLVYSVKKHGLRRSVLLQSSFVLFALLFILLYWLKPYQELAITIASLACNIYLASIAVISMWKSLKFQQLGMMNYGLVILSLLITLRFFDSFDFSFLARGLFFVAIGSGFLLINHSMLKKRRKLAPKI